MCKITWYNELSNNHTIFGTSGGLCNLWKETFDSLKRIKLSLKFGGAKTWQEEIENSKPWISKYWP